MIDRPGVLASDSLLQLELIRVALSDPAAQWCSRPIDATWYYAELLPRSMAGFNPSMGKVYYAASSATAAWIEGSYGSTREFNEKDRLVREILFGVHDYLHGFAYRVIQQRHPELRFGTGPISASNFEVYVFLHLLTEAVATAGLDYWFLCTFELEQRLRIGSNVRSLTVSYHLSDEDEYRRFHPELAVQEPGFLRQLCEFYCSGEFIGFDLADVRRSPRLLRWLTHEIAYGEIQRRYVREWFAYLAHDDIRRSPNELGAPVVCDAEWKDALVDDMAAALWALVKDRQRPYWGVKVDAEPWTSPAGKPVDFRFTDLAAVELGALADEIEAGMHTRSNAMFALDQYLAGFEFKAMRPELRDVVPMLRDKADLKLAITLLGNEPRLPASHLPDRDIFLPA